MLNLVLGAIDSETTIEFFPEVPGFSTLYPTAKRLELAAIVGRARCADVWMADPKLALLLLPLYPWGRRVLRGIIQRVLSSGEAFPCTVRTVSSMIRALKTPGIDLLKVDMEGAEIDVLAGIEDEHWSTIRMISMEVAPANLDHFIRHRLCNDG